MAYKVDPHNLDTPLCELLSAAIDEMNRVVDRSYTTDRRQVLRLSVPARNTDSDILILDALHRALTLVTSAVDEAEGHDERAA